MSLHAIEPTRSRGQRRVDGVGRPNEIPQVVFYSFAVISVIQGLAEKPHLKGEPVLFLLIAPPSVAATCFANFHGGRFRGVPVSVLGYALVMLSVLLLSGPKLAGEPKLLGSYWAYVFPVAALGSACINYAAYENSPEAKAVAWVVFIIAETLLILVFVRTMYHSAQVARGRALWRDPLAPASAWVDEKTGGRVGHCEGDDAAITPA